jgi:hypothetical protein
VADSAIARLRGILAATMSGAAIEQLLAEVFAELAEQQPRLSAIDQPIPYQLADKPLWTDASTYAYHARLCLVCGHETSHWTEQSPAAEQMEQHLATHLAAAEHARCCMCGSIEVRYRNYREQPFCWPCADGTSPEAKVQLAAALEAMNG